MINPLENDLNAVLALTGSLWDGLRGKRIFITGGTGFFGCWLLESFTCACDRLGLGAEAWVLSRSPEAFAQRAPHLANHPAVHLLGGDVRNFDFPQGEFPVVIHAATDASARLTAENPLLMLDTILEGTRRTLEFARTHQARQFLLASSGAVYGRQPPDLERIPENYSGGPDPTSPRSAYAEGKRIAEQLAVLYAQQYGMEVKIARGFAFLGPYLPLDIHFAAGNFIRDGLAGGPILIQGDGTPLRSYLYASDLAVWLWTILLRGRCGAAYNLGSEEAVSIAELAHTTAAAFDPRPGVEIARAPIPGALPERYVPDTTLARSELGLRQTVSLPEAIERTVRWRRLQSK
jgi:dTDP-glucose 4,6-dehydratase